MPTPRILADGLAGWPFAVTALAGIVLLRQPALRRRRAEVLALLSLAFAGSTLRGPGDAVCLAALCATGWLLVRVLSWRRHPALLAVGIAVVLAELVLSRETLPASGAPFGLTGCRITGLSFIMFRVIHVAVDAQGGEAPRLSKRQFIAYLTSYPGFLAGPVQRVQDFVRDLDGAPEWRTPLAVAGPRIAGGALKYTALAGACHGVFVWTQTSATAMPLAPRLAAGWLSFACYLYIGFSGYTDVVRGLAGLCGLHPPENFDHPFAAPNLLEFWARWHMSLSEWFKLYVFNPVVKAMIARAPSPAATPYLGVAGYFLTFFLMGLWHGSSVRFAVYGLVLGAGVSGNKLYQQVMRRRLGRSRYAALAGHPLYRAAAGALAGAFFILALGFIWCPAAPAASEAGSWLLGGLAVVVVTFVTVLAAPLPRRWGAALPMPASAPWAVPAAQVAVAALYVLLGGPVPPLLYAYF